MKIRYHYITTKQNRLKRLKKKRKKDIAKVGHSVVISLTHQEDIIILSYFAPSNRMKRT